MTAITPRAIIVSDRITLVDIERRRGDTAPEHFRLYDSRLTVLDITGRTFRLAVNPSKTPADASDEIYELTATIVDAEAGEVAFLFASGDEDATPGRYFFDLEMTFDDGDFSAVIKTIAAGRWTISQDIAK